ncbi:hypothetical protein [Nonomuraea zeae]
MANRQRSRSSTPSRIRNGTPPSRLIRGASHCPRRTPTATEIPRIAR